MLNSFVIKTRSAKKEKHTGRMRSIGSPLCIVETTQISVYVEAAGAEADGAQTDAQPQGVAGDVSKPVPDRGA